MVDYAISTNGAETDLCIPQILCGGITDFLVYLFERDVSASTLKKLSFCRCGYPPWIPRQNLSVRQQNFEPISQGDVCFMIPDTQATLLEPL